MIDFRRHLLIVVPDQHFRGHKLAQLMDQNLPADAHDKALEIAGALRASAQTVEDQRMLGGAELASAIVRHSGDKEAALTAFGEPMFSRAAAEAVDAHDMLKRCLGNHAPSSFLHLVMEPYETASLTRNGVHGT